MLIAMAVPARTDTAVSVVACVTAHDLHLHFLKDQMLVVLVPVSVQGHHRCECKCL